MAKNEETADKVEIMNKVEQDAWVAFAAGELAHSGSLPQALQNADTMLVALRKRLKARTLWMA